MRPLAARLQAALGFDESERAAWERCLGLLLRRCADDRLTIEGRLLYDLQKVCVDHEREIFTVDLSEWILSLGRHPIRRPLPALKEVLTCKHLRIALRRSHDVALAQSDRSRLTELLHAALDHAEENARDHLRPGIAESLRSVGLVPANVPEEVGRHKMVEELLDKAVESGYLRFGDLRDAISRNNLKLPDLASLETFGTLARQASARVDKGTRAWLLFPVIYVWLWLKHLLFGDHLLRADRALAGPLDGVYHRAEVYLRLFQRITSYGFGIGLGRLLNRFLILPLLGAFLVVSFYQEMAHLTKLDHLIPSGNVKPAADEPQTTPLIEAIGLVFSEGWDAATAAYPASLAWLGVLGLFFLGLINSAAVRRITARVGRRVVRTAGAVLRSLVRWLARPLIQAILYNPWIVLTRRYVLKPAMITLLVWLVLLVGFDRQMTLAAVVGVFIGLNFLINSRVGRNVEEITNEWLAKTWVNVRSRVAFGLYWLIVDLSNAFLEAVDRLLYAVDEWLRFRRGESRLSFGAKAGLGALWTAITYLVRFTVNLLIEPQINPIKHFPVVTVSHKVVWSLAIVITPMVADATGWDQAYTLGLLSTIAWAIPGIFGFLAWELKENWKLYAANRPATLRPVRIGHHGETMGRLLVPGFHSGTVPKLFRKIRRAHRRSRRQQEAVADLLRKPLKQLAQVRHALGSYIAREFFYLLKQCPAGRHEVRLGDIDLATNRIRLELRSGESADDPCWVIFEQQGGWLLADVVPGWAARLPADQRAMFRDALVGLFKTSGVELVRPHLAGLWPGPWASYRVCPDDRLVLWPSDAHAAEISYRLGDRGTIEPVSTAEVPAAFAPVAAGDLLFSSVALPWPVWVEAWDRHAQGRVGAAAPTLRSPIGGDIFERIKGVLIRATKPDPRIRTTQSSLRLPFYSRPVYDGTMATDVQTGAPALPPGQGRIVVTPGVCGGKPHIAGHRIKVQHVAIWFNRLGLSADEIVSQHPELSLADVHSALAYYFDHREEIEADIRAGREFAEQLRDGAPSIFEKARQGDGADDSLPPG